MWCLLTIVTGLRLLTMQDGNGVSSVVLETEVVVELEVYSGEVEGTNIKLARSSD